MNEFLSYCVVLGLCGAVSGLLAGLFGIGGGAILVPALIAVFNVLKVPADLIAHLAIGTSLGIIVPTSIRSYLAHRKRGAGDTALLKSWVFTVPAGVITASFAVSRLPGTFLKSVFAAVALFIAVKMILNPKSWKLGDDLPGPTGRQAVGFGIGFISTLMGIGGGNLNNLFMTLYGRPIHQAVATSAGLGLLVSVPATVGYIWAGYAHPGLPPWSLGYVNLLAVLLVTPFSILAAPFGARLAHRLRPRQLEVTFGLFLIVIVASILI